MNARIILLVCVALLGCAGPAPAPPRAAQLSPTPPAIPVPIGHIYMGAPRAMNESSAWVLLHNEGYDVGYSERHKDPLWAAYTLRRDAPRFDSRRPSARFADDPRVRGGVSDRDYVRSGFDRGHMAPSDAIGRWYGPQAQTGTFIVTNICPQRHANNAGDWAGLEAAVTDLYARTFQQVWVICGPIFDAQPPQIAHGIDVPAAFYKIVVEADGGSPRVLAVIMDQEIQGHHPLGTYLTTVRTIEERTLLDFFPELPREVQDQIETAQADESLWNAGAILNNATLRNR